MGVKKRDFVEENVGTLLSCLINQLKLEGQR
jgi:hypothetical protein